MVIDREEGQDKGEAAGRARVRLEREAYMGFP